MAKICGNCAEPNSDGASECVLCSEPMEIAQKPPLALPPPLPPPPQEEVINDISEVGAVMEVTAIPASPTAPTIPLKDEEQSSELAPKFAPEPTPEPAPEPTPEPAPTPEPEPASSPEPAAQALVPVPALIPVPAPVPAPVPSLKTVVIHVFHDTEPRVVHTHSVVNDMTLIGREDPQRDIFPDLDLGKYAEEGVSAASASRQHLRLIRQGNEFFLFIYKGTTGTQINKEIIPEEQYGKRFPINLGDRIILGGKIRLKLVG